MVPEAQRLIDEANQRADELRAARESGDTGKWLSIAAGVFGALARAREIQRAATSTKPATPPDGPDGS